MGKQIEKTTSFTADELRSKAEIIEYIAQEMREVADVIDRLQGKTIQIKFASTLKKGFDSLQTWVVTAKSTANRELFELSGESKSIKQDSQTTDETVEKFKRKKKEPEK